MAKIHVDGRECEAKAGDNLLHACLSAGLDLPYFCWHPALHSVGACRQCAVKQFKDEKDTRGRIVMACMTPVTDGMRVSIDDPEAKAFRAKVIEFLMVSHPHDCPVCDEGGECHLQDMTLMTGHTYRKYRFPKATFRNQDLGPFLNHEMNRCIECYRCVRFYRDHAGGRDLNVFGVRDRVYFGRQEDGVLESEFSGNLAEVCPTGVFTDKTLGRHYNRKWDLRQAPSICAHCGAGCNTIAAERYGGLRRIQNRFNDQVNGYFICDRGRFGYEFVNSDRRITAPLVRADGSKDAVPVHRDEALGRVREILGDGTRAVAIGSPRASLESNFALRELVGPSRFSPGHGPGEARLVSLVLRILREGAVRTPSIAEVEASDAVLVLGEDPTATAARLALALRQSVRRAPMAAVERLGIPPWHDAAIREAIGDARGPLFIAAPWPTRLDDIAAEPYRAAPDDIALLGHAVAREVHAGSPDPGPVPEAVRALAARIAAALKGARKPVVVSGIASGSEAVIRAAADVALALRREGRTSASPTPSPSRTRSARPSWGAWGSTRSAACSGRGSPTSSSSSRTTSSAGAAPPGPRSSSGRPGASWRSITSGPPSPSGPTPSSRRRPSPRATAPSSPPRGGPGGSSRCSCPRAGRSRRAGDGWGTCSPSPAGPGEAGPASTTSSAPSRRGSPRSPASPRRRREPGSASPARRSPALPTASRAGRP